MLSDRCASEQKVGRQVPRSRCVALLLLVLLISDAVAAVHIPCDVVVAEVFACPSRVQSDFVSFALADIVIVDEALEDSESEKEKLLEDGLDARYNERFQKRMESLKRAVRRAMLVLL